MSRRVSQPGLTLLEVVVSVAMLAGFASIVLGAVSLMENAAVRERHRLNATEVAHRVIVQIIDDHTVFERQVQRVQQGDFYYQFDYRIDVVYREEGIEGQSSSRRRTRPASESSVEERLRAQIHEITVTVYLERPDGTRSLSPYATLHRLYNPVMGEGERGIQWVMDLFKEQYGNL